MGHGAAAQCCGAISLGAAVAASVAPSHPTASAAKWRAHAVAPPALAPQRRIQPTAQPFSLPPPPFRIDTCSCSSTGDSPPLPPTSTIAPSCSLPPAARRPPAAVPAAPYQPLGRCNTGPLRRSGRRPSLPLASCTSSGPIPAALQGNGCFPIRI